MRSRGSKGFTLIEILIVLVILGIMIPILLSFFLNLARQMKRLQLMQVASAASTQATAPRTQVKFAAVGEASEWTPLLCFKNAQAMGCDPEHPCTFECGRWVRKNTTCDDGVLLLY